MSGEYADGGFPSQKFSPCKRKRMSTFCGEESRKLAPPVVLRHRRDLGRAASLPDDELGEVGIETGLNKPKESLIRAQTAAVLDWEIGFAQDWLAEGKGAGNFEPPFWEQGKVVGNFTSPATPVSVLSSASVQSPALGAVKNAHRGDTLGAASHGGNLKPVDKSFRELLLDERMGEADYDSDGSMADDLESVRTSFEMFDSERPSFDFTSEFKGQFRPLPAMVPEMSQNLEGFAEGFAEAASEGGFSGGDTPSTSSQEFMQMVSDQVEGKMSKAQNNPLLNLLGQESGAWDEEAELLLLDHETAEQYIKSSLRMQLLRFGVLAVASVTSAGFMLSVLFSNIRISSERLPPAEGGGGRGAHGHEWWIFGSSAAQGLLALLVIMVMALVGTYTSDNRKAVHKAQVKAERREQDDLLASRRSERRAMERARTATRAKQQFMAYVFHNIRVPFNAIVLGLGHMRAAESGDTLPGDKMDLVQMMLDCAETMTSVLDDVTDMSQWEDNKLDLRTDSFDLLAVVRFLSWGLRDLLDQKNIKFGMVIDPRARAVLNNHNTVGDKHRVVQVLGQFLSNAVKLTPVSGEINLVMACEDLEWIDEEPLGQIGWRIVRPERRPSSHSSSFPRGPPSSENLHSSPSLSYGSDPMSSGEDVIPRRVSLTPRGKRTDSETADGERRRNRRRSFERAPPLSANDPFRDLPAVQSVNSDEMEVESGGADSEPGDTEPTPRGSSRGEQSGELDSPRASAGEEELESVLQKSRRDMDVLRAQPGESDVKPSPLDVYKPAKLVLPQEEGLKTGFSQKSPAGPLEIARLPSVPSSAGSGVLKQESLPAPPQTPRTSLGLATTRNPGGSRSRRGSLDSTSLSPELTADIAAALSSGYSGVSPFGIPDRIGGIKLSKEAIARGGLTSPVKQLSLEGGGDGKPAVNPLDEKTRDDLEREIRKQKRKGLNETILELKGGELEGDRGRRPSPRKKKEKDKAKERQSFEKERPSFRKDRPEPLPTKMSPMEGSHESLSPSGSGRGQSSKSLASLPIVGFATMRISVKDTGPAITEEEQEKLFEPYSRIATGCMQRAGVSTLGLSLAKRFVRQVGGSIGVDSQAPNGNTFWFSIPFPLVAEHDTGNESNSLASSDVEKTSDSGMGSAPPPTPPGPLAREAQDELNRMFTEKLAKKLSGGGPQPGKASAVERALHQAITRSLSGSLRGDLEQMSELRKQLSVEKEGEEGVRTQAEKDANEGKRRVLLVEDTEINRIIMRKVLQNLGLLCDEAENGKVAVDLLKQGRSYDLILMDKEMPVMDGHEATRLLRKMGVKTPIIALTGNALKSDRELFFEAGVDEFQTKPLSRDKLVQLLVRLGWKKEQLGKGDGNVFSPRVPPPRKAAAAASVL